ncbi:MAG: PQQ-binding-like beta-propeller repeat protein [Acidimicrobiales bacterium]
MRARHPHRAPADRIRHGGGRHRVRRLAAGTGGRSRPVRPLGRAPRGRRRAHGPRPAAAEPRPAGALPSLRLRRRAGGGRGPRRLRGRERAAQLRSVELVGVHPGAVRSHERPHHPQRVGIDAGQRREQHRRPRRHPDDRQRARPPPGAGPLHRERLRAALGERPRRRRRVRRGVGARGRHALRRLRRRALALDPDTGEERWTTDLHDKVTSGCSSCFAAVGDRLVVRTTDAYVTAYGEASGEPLWSKRLRSTVGSMSVASGRLFVVDDPEVAQYLTQVLQLDPDTGQVVHAISPSCVGEEQASWLTEASPGDRVFGVPGSDDVVMAFGFGDGCVVRWEPDAGAVRWATLVPDVSTLSRGQVLVGDDDLVAGTSNDDILAVALDDGTARRLAPPPDTSVDPLAVVGRTLVGASATSRGTPRRGLVGWDLATGERRWAERLEGDPEPTSSDPEWATSDALFEGSPRLLLQPTADGVDVVVFEGEQRTFSVAPLDLADGSMGAEVRRGLLTRYESGTVSLTVEHVSPERIVVSVDNALQALPSGGRGPVVGFPDGD